TQIAQLLKEATASLRFTAALAQGRHLRLKATTGTSFQPTISFTATERRFPSLHIISPEGCIFVLCEPPSGTYWNEQMAEQDAGYYLNCKGGGNDKESLRTN
ncbi:unnamed protein product, partial [marine sediment metagenome]